MYTAHLIAVSSTHPTTSSQAKHADSKHINGVYKGAVVIGMVCDSHAIPRNHFLAADGINVVEIDVVGVAAALDAQDVELAFCGCVARVARRVVVVEEGVETHAVAEDGVAAHDAETPARCYAWGGGGVGEGWFGGGGVARDGEQRDEGE